MKKTKTFLIDLVIAAVLAAAVVILLDAADKGISHLSLTISEQIVMAKMIDNSISDRMITFSFQD